MAALKLNLCCRDLAPTEATPRLRENYVIAPWQENSKPGAKLTDCC
jgi:hypothetical protein